MLHLTYTLKVTSNEAYDSCQILKKKEIKHDGLNVRTDARKEAAPNGKKKKHGHLIYSSFPGRSSIITLVPAGPSLCQTLNVFIMCQTEGEECVPKTGSTLLPAERQCSQNNTKCLGVLVVPHF